ncbi:MAG TPA: hypothetical protein VGS20_07440 [Candidatus Acidoferrales bacterium]|nr:hypothetical protein [Candidatus Acidoferrales bacterium]
MRLGRKAIWAAAVALLPAAASSAWAQGCALCYTTASALDKRGIHSLDAGIIVLFFPPVFIFSGILYFLHRRRRAWAAHSREDSPPDLSAGGSLPAFPSSRSRG